MDHAETDGTRLLGMELDGIDVVSLKYGRIGMHVGASRGSRVDHRCVIAMGKIRERLLGKTGQETRRTSALERIPAHVRDTACTREARDGAGKNPKPMLAKRFFAPVEQTLKSNADAQERNTGMNLIQQRIAKSEMIESPDHLTEVTNTGQDDLVCALNRFRIIRHL